MDAQSNTHSETPRILDCGVLHTLSIPWLCALRVYFTLRRWGLPLPLVCVDDGLPACAWELVSAPPPRRSCLLGVEVDDVALLVWQWGRGQRCVVKGGSVVKMGVVNE